MPRALVAAAVVLIALVGGGLWWVSHLQAIEFAGTGGGGSLMKTLPSLDADEYESDPPPTYALAHVREDQLHLGVPQLAVDPDHHHRRGPGRHGRHEPALRPSALPAKTRSQLPTISGDG